MAHYGYDELKTSAKPRTVEEARKQAEDGEQK
jgi:hypothetical protein